MKPIIEAIDLMDVQEENCETDLEDASIESIHISQGGDYCTDVC